MSLIVTLTLNPAVDASCAVGEVVPDKKLRCSSTQYDPGGGGINVARAIRNLNGEAAAVWTCGGPMGQLLRNLLDRENIDHSPIPIQQPTRENFIVFDESSERQYRFGTPGPHLSRQEADDAVRRVQAFDPPPDVLVLSGSLPPGADEDIYAQLARQVPDACRTVVDTSGMALRRALETPVYLIKPNLRELRQLAGRQIEGDDQVFDVSRRLIEDGHAEVVVTSLGSSGAMLVTADRRERLHAPAVPVRSRIGAGDSTVAGIVLGLTRGWSVLEAARFGLAAGTAAVMTEGTTLCRRSDTEQIYEQMQRDSVRTPI